MYINNNDFIKQSYNRKKTWYRLRLGCMQFIHKPLLNFLWIVVFLLFTLFLHYKDMALEQFNVHQMIVPIFDVSVMLIVVIIPILSILFIFECVGERTARKDEACLILAFDAKHLRYGYPILIQKKKTNGTDITFREFYTTIPYQAWIDKKDAIADAMNVHFIEDIQYGGKNHADGNRIILITAKGRKKAKRGNLYDDDF